MGLLDILALLIVIGLFVVVSQLSKLNAQMQGIASQVNSRDLDSVHDTMHPVFSLRQLRRVRQRFEREYKKQLQLETALYSGTEWRSRGDKEGVSTKLRDHLRGVCEALVECECLWKEYVWMVEGNLSVVAGRESRSAILHEFRDLLKDTRGISAVMNVAPNSVKVRRVEQILTNWTGRLTGATKEALAIEIPDTAEETFDVVIEERQRSVASMAFSAVRLV